MSLKRTSHAVYEAKYHLVWCPNYRKRVLIREIRPRVKELFLEVASQFDFEIDSCEVSEDHVHILISFPPRYSVAKVVERIMILKKLPDLWSGSFTPEKTCIVLKNLP